MGGEAAWPNERFIFALHCYKRGRRSVRRGLISFAFANYAVHHSSPQGTERRDSFALTTVNAS